jgi:BASS family bile acid:Na+ symporter
MPNALLQWLVPACVFVMMICIGLDVAPARFAALLRTPRPLVLGLLGQLVIGPVCGIAVGFLFRDHLDIALGIVLLVASPGGPVSNAMVYIFRGLPEVSVVLTAINGLVSLVTTPLIVYAGFALLAHEEAHIRLPLQGTMQHILVMVVIPMVLGACLRQFLRHPEALSKWARKASMGMLALILFIILYTSHERMVQGLTLMLPATLLVCLLILVGTAGLVRLSGLGPDMRFTIATEVSIHNVPVALLMSEVILMQPRLSAVILLYAPVIALLVGAWGTWRLFHLGWARRLQ